MSTFSRIHTYICPLTSETATPQPSTSAALLMALLRICQVASLISVDQSGTPRRLSSLAQLPIAVMLFFMVLHHIRRVGNVSVS